MQNLKVELQVGSGYYGVRCENVHVIIMPKAPNIVTFCDRDAPSGYCTVTLSSSAGDAGCVRCGRTLLYLRVNNFLL